MHECINVCMYIIIYLFIYLHYLHTTFTAKKKYLKNIKKSSSNLSKTAGFLYKAATSKQWLIKKIFK